MTNRKQYIENWTEHIKALARLGWHLNKEPNWQEELKPELDGIINRLNILVQIAATHKLEA